MCSLFVRYVANVRQLFVSDCTWCYSGVKITGGTVELGDGSITASNILNDYSFIYLTEMNLRRFLFRCSSGLSSNSNDNIGNVYFNDMLLTTGNCNGFVEPRGAKIKSPGVFNVHLCESKKLTTSTEGIYTCTLKNSSMMNQSVNVGVYLQGRSKLFHIKEMANHLSVS